MKFGYRVPALFLTLLLTGCEHKQMTAYIEQLETLLKEYQSGVNGRMTAERKLYAELAERHATEAEREFYESLRVERLHQQRVQTAGLVEKRLTPAQVQERMRDTAVLEVERSKEYFEREMNVEASYQSSLGRVALDAKKIQALEAALRAMRKTEGFPVEFAAAFQKEFQAAECKAIAREIALKEESIALLKAEKRNEEAQALAAELAALLPRKCK